MIFGYARVSVGRGIEECEAVQRRDVNAETLRSIGRSYNVSAQTISGLPPSISRALEG